jgi:hypothetical protein
MLRSLIEEVGNRQEQLGYISREMEMSRKNSNKILKIKKHCDINKDHLCGVHLWNRNNQESKGLKICQ